MQKLWKRLFYINVINNISEITNAKAMEENILH